MHSGIRTINLSMRTRQPTITVEANERCCSDVMPTNVLGTDLCGCCSYPRTSFYRQTYCRLEGSVHGTDSRQIVDWHILASDFCN